MAFNTPLCYYTFILTKRRNMDYENDYDLLQDVFETEMWDDHVQEYLEDMEEED
jgi:hypothetical protein